MSSNDTLPVALDGETKNPLAVSRNEEAGAENIVPFSTPRAWFGHFAVASKLVESCTEEPGRKALDRFLTQ